MRRKLSDRILFIGIPALIAILVFWVDLSQNRSPDINLLLIAPSEARSGGNLPMRTLFFEGLNTIKGPRLSHRPTQVVLMDHEGREIHSTWLQKPQALEEEIGLFGVLPLNESWQGLYRLQARIFSGKHLMAQVDKHLKISAAPARAESQGRAQLPLQSYSLQALKCTPQPCRPEDELLPKVIGGVCVTESPCELIVFSSFAGEWLLEHSEFVKPLGATTGVFEKDASYQIIPIMIIGPEADVKVSLHHGARALSQKVRLPIEPGGFTMRTPQRFFNWGQAVEIQVGPGPSGAAGSAVLVDLFRDGQWEYTAGFAAPDNGTIKLPFLSMNPGLWRLQVYADPLGTDHVATRFVEVLPLEQHDSGHTEHDRPDALTFAYRMADEETVVIKEPEAVTSIIQQTLGNARKAQLPMRIAFATMLFIALISAAMLMQRVANAKKRVERLMQSAERATGLATTGTQSRGSIILLCLALLGSSLVMTWLALRTGMLN